MELEDAGGIEILSDTLKDENATEEEKSEAAGLLAQVTSPWIENNNTIEGLSRHLNDLVQSLTSKLLYKLGIQIRNMKMDFYTGGTWRRVGQ